MIINQPNEDGIVFVTGKENKYFVIYDMDGEYVPKVETGREIFNRMDMSDCYDITIVRLWLIKGDYITSARFLGTHHDRNENLKMEIVDTITGEVFDIGYGNDH